MQKTLHDFFVFWRKNEDFKTFFKLHRSKKSPTANYNDCNT